MKIVRTGTFTPAMVRLELYALLNEIRKLQNTHLQVFSHRHPECYVCQSFEDEKSGIRRAIKHFGGNPNGGRP